MVPDSLYCLGPLIDLDKVPVRSFVINAKGTAVLGCLESMFQNVINLEQKVAKQTTMPNRTVDESEDGKQYQLYRCSYVSTNGLLLNLSIILEAMLSD